MSIFEVGISAHARDVIVSYRLVGNKINMVVPLMMWLHDCCGETTSFTSEIIFIPTSKFDCRKWKMCYILSDVATKYYNTYAERLTVSFLIYIYGLFDISNTCMERIYSISRLVDLFHLTVSKRL